MSGHLVWIHVRCELQRPRTRAAVSGTQASYTELLEIGNTRGKLSARNLCKVVSCKYMDYILRVC